MTVIFVLTLIFLNQYSDDATALEVIATSIIITFFIHDVIWLLRR